MRRLLTDLLQSDPLIEVVGGAEDPYVAREKIKALNPDVLTLDVEMPKMDGLTFLRNLMRLRPMPVVMVSSLTERGAEITLEALDLGAVDFVSKPKIDLEAGMSSCARELIDKVKTASVAKVTALARVAGRPDRPPPAAAVQSQSVKYRNFSSSEQLIAIGASTGGTEAVKEVLSCIRSDSPGVVITQHIPPMFSKSFARRMDRCSRLQVCEAEDGQFVLPGHAYIAPGDKHLTISKDGGRYRCVLNDGPEVSGHRPSVDVLFDSVVRSAGRNAIGVILTGMGRDGADALRRLRDGGAETMAQDEESCVVYGMPKAAVEAGAAKEVLTLADIAPRLDELTRSD
jgi:two-component system chemotaxis response regulator CheB